jgi:DNA-binding response OmpR family regulator
VTVLLVDNDLGFMFWLGGVLRAAGHDVAPAVTTRAAQSLTRKPGVSIDLLLLSPTVAGARALAEKVRRTHPAVRVVALLDADRSSGPLTWKPDLYYRKPRDSRGVSEARWLELIHNAVPRRSVAS